MAVVCGDSRKKSKVIHCKSKVVVFLNVDIRCYLTDKLYALTVSFPRFEDKQSAQEEIAIHYCTQISSSAKGAHRELLLCKY
jgi:hypothetical protein